MLDNSEGHCSFSTNYLINWVLQTVRDTEWLEMWQHLYGCVSSLTLRRQCVFLWMVKILILPFTPQTWFLRKCMASQAECNWGRKEPPPPLGGENSGGKINGILRKSNTTSSSISSPWFMALIILTRRCWCCWYQTQWVELWRVRNSSSLGSALLFLDANSVYLLCKEYNTILRCVNDWWFMNSKTRFSTIWVSEDRGKKTCERTNPLFRATAFQRASMQWASETALHRKSKGGAKPARCIIARRTYGFYKSVVVKIWFWGWE